MSAKTGLTAGILGLLLAGTGCVTCHHKGFAESLSCQSSPTPCPVRQEVYIFAMNGADVCDLCGLSTLRDRLCKNGYSKIYIGGTQDRGWFEREIGRIRRSDPAARFVLVGVGAAADSLLKLVGCLNRDGAPLDAVVFLDPVGVSADLGMLPQRTVAIRSCFWLANGLVARENVTNADTGHFGLPGHDLTVQLLVDVLTESAMRVGPLDGPPLPAMPLSDTPLPTPRPVSPTPSEVRDEWDFLKLPQSPLTQPGTAVATAPPRTPAPAVTSVPLPTPELGSPPTSPFYPTSRSR